MTEKERRKKETKKKERCAKLKFSHSIFTTFEKVSGTYGVDLALK